MEISLNMEKWIESCIGEYQFVKSVKNLCATHNSVKVIKDFRERVYYLKLFTDKKKWNTESFAYKYLLNFKNEFIPKYYGSYSDEKNYAILLSALDGESFSLRINEIKESDKELIYYNAGKKLFEIQSNNKKNAVSFGEVYQDESIKYSTAIEYIKARFSQNAKFLHLIDEKLAYIYKQSYDMIDKLYYDEEPILVNGDDGIRNWIINSKNKFIGFIDFEYLNWGIKEQSLLSIMLSAEHLRNAFFNGYGVHSEIQKSDKFLTYQILSGISTLLFGKLNNNNKAIYIGNKIIDRYKKFNA